MENHTEDAAILLSLSDEMTRLMDTEAFKTGVTLVKARIFTEWASTKRTDVVEREALHSEQRALERLLESFTHIIGEGLVAREAIRRQEQEDTSLS